MDRYCSFEHLKTCEAEGIDYRIRWRIGYSGIAILSIHGGDIEPGTSQIADAISGHEHTFYALEGIKTAGNMALHITSRIFDEPTALEIVCHAEIIISVHGCAETEEVVHLGGLDMELKDRIRELLCEAGFSATDSANPNFQGIDQANICNLCGRSMGVQLEISKGLRSRMFRDLSPKGRKYPTEIFSRFTQAVRDAIEPFGGVFAEPETEVSTD